MYSDRSLAELFVHENLANLVERGFEVLRVFEEALNVLGSTNNIRRVYEKILEPKSRVEEARLMFMEYLVRVSEGIAIRDHYMRIASGIERLAQIVEGVVYRFTLAKERGISIDSDLMGNVKEFLKIIKEQYVNIHKGVKNLRERTKEILSLANDIVRLEARADELYRSTTISIYTKYSNDIAALMLFKDIVDFIEEASDTLKNIGEELRYIALHRVVIS